MIRIGKIAGTHGLKGEVLLSHLLVRGWLKKDIPLFLTIRRDTHIPYFLESFQEVDDTTYRIKLEEVNTMEEARALTGKQVLVDEQYVNLTPEASPLLWLGFEVHDKELGAVGALKDVFQTAHQWLGELPYQGKDVLIPLVPQTILKLDVNKKIIYMDLPAGLLEV